LQTCLTWEGLHLDSLLDQVFSDQLDEFIYRLRRHRFREKNEKMESTSAVRVEQKWLEAFAPKILVDPHCGVLIALLDICVWLVVMIDIKCAPLAQILSTSGMEAN